MKELGCTQSHWPGQEGHRSPATSVSPKLVEFHYRQHFWERTASFLTFTLLLPQVLLPLAESVNKGFQSEWILVDIKGVTIKKKKVRKLNFHVQEHSLGGGSHGAQPQKPAHLWSAGIKV